MAKRPRVTVLGSLNMDISVTVPRLPGPGATVLGSAAVFTPGGKGANQAVAAARLGAEVRMAGCVGDDDFGRRLLAALRDFPLRNRERLTFEYVLLGGVNDTPAHARELVDLIRGLRAKVNLIALNPGPEIPFSMPDSDRVLAFQSALIGAGIPAFIRRPRGRDIYAACGQLKHTTELVKLT